MIEKILNYLPYVVGLFAGIFVYFKGYSDRKREEQASKADILEAYSKIESEKVDEKDVYNNTKW